MVLMNGSFMQFKDLVHLRRRNFKAVNNVSEITAKELQTTYVARSTTIFQFD